LFYSEAIIFRLTARFSHIKFFLIVFTTSTY